jgi:hypothetical protein
MLQKVIGTCVLVLLVATACGNESDGESTAPIVADPDALSMAASSPIGAYFEDGGGLEAAFAEYGVKVDEQITVCMAQQGFEYGASAPDVPEIDRLQGELTVHEWTAQFGYGVSTSFDSIIAQQASDPNTEIFLTMSPDEQELWIAALTGQSEDGFEFAPALEDQGCIGEAILATGGGDVIDGIESFGNAYDEGEDALFDRREMVDAVDAWSRCLSEAGYGHMAAREDPEESITDRFTEVVAPLDAAIEDIDPDDARALFAGDSVELEDLPGLDVQALRELQDDERALALADLDCYEDHVKVIFEPLRDDFENGLLTEYQGELDALRTIGE